MTVRTALCALALAVAPTLGIAMCFDHANDTAASCAEGQVWDPQTQACVEQVNS